MLKKYLTLCIILIILSFSLYGCYDAVSIEQYAYVIAIGIDEGKQNEIKLSLQFAISDSSSDGSSQSNKSSVITVECSTIDSGIAIVNSYISKIICLSHCQIIAISENLAVNGIEDYIDTLINNIEIRPDCNILITKCNASDYIKNANPILTDLVARYYEVLLNSESYTGYTTTTPIYEISSSSHSVFSQYVAMLGGLNFEESKNNNNSETNNNLIDKGSELKPSETPITGNTVSQIMGLAILNNMKLVGELDSLESVCFLILKNKLERCIISIPSPFNDDEAIDILLKLNNSTKSNVKLINKTPFISCDIKLSGIIQSYPGSVDYTSEDNIKIVEEYTSSYISSKISEFLYKTAKNYNTDIVGFGYKTSPMFSNINDWQNSSWVENYKNSFFNVNVNTEIKSISLFLTH